MAAVVILLGAPGAGKGTQAVRLSQSCRLPHVSTGDLFRENLSQGTELGAAARGFMEEGKLVPDKVVLDMLYERVGRDDCRDGYVLDGFPRTVPQAEALDAHLGGDVDLTVASLEVSEDTIVRRAAGRLVCASCGRVHHAEFDPPSLEGACDACGGKLGQRQDDRPSVVRERLRVYRDLTAPVVEHYREAGVLVTVDGERPPEEVFTDLKSLCAGRR